MTKLNTTLPTLARRPSTWWLLGAVSLLAGCAGDALQLTSTNNDPQSAEITGRQSLPTAPKQASEVPALNASSGMDGASSELYATTNERSGSRIQARMLRTNEGFSSWVGWHDEELNVDCDFARDAEGTQRCFPTTAVRDIYYADADCKLGIAAQGTDNEVAEPARYAYKLEQTECGKGIRPYSLAAVIEAPTQIFALVAGECVAKPVPAATFFGLGAAVGLEQFVAARNGVEESSARVKAVGLVADDGAVRVTGFVDSVLKTPCTWSGTDQVACVPSANPVAMFADEVCSQPLLEAKNNSCSDALSDAPSFGISTDADGCNAAYYRPADPFQGSTVYELSADAYQVRSVSQQETGALFMSQPLAEDQFAPGMMQTDSSRPTRLKAVNWTTRDGGVWFSHWYDNTLATTCSFVQTGNNEWRCVPETPAGLVYADSDCTQAVAEAPRFGTCGAPLEKPAFVTSQSARAHSVIEVRQVLSPHPLLVVHKLTSSGKCEARPAAENSEHFDVTDPMPATSFISGKIPLD